MTNTHDPRPSTRKHVVVVDHSPDLQRLGQFLLESEGYRATPFSLDMHSPEQIAAAHPEAFIINVVNKEQDLDLLGRLKAKTATAETPVLVLSTAPDLLEYLQKNRALYAGHRFLLIPEEFDQIVPVLRSLMSQP